MSPIRCETCGALVEGGYVRTFVLKFRIFAVGKYVGREKDGRRTEEGRKQFPTIRSLSTYPFLYFSCLLNIHF